MVTFNSDLTVIPPSLTIFSSTELLHVSRDTEPLHGKHCMHMLVQDRCAGYILPQYGPLGWPKRATRLRRRQAEPDQMSGYGVSTNGVMRV